LFREHATRLFATYSKSSGLLIPAKRIESAAGALMTGVGCRTAKPRTSAGLSPGLCPWFLDGAVKTSAALLQILSSQLSKGYGGGYQGFASVPCACPSCRRCGVRQSSGRPAPRPPRHGGGVREIASRVISGVTPGFEPVMSAHRICLGKAVTAWLPRDG
jgi:hypothetical protein